MKRYWVISPYEKAKKEFFHKAWNFDLAHGTIAVGWIEMGDIANLSRAQLADKFAQTYPNHKTPTTDLNQLLKFYFDIAPDDVVIARSGTKIILSVGIVKHSAYYDEFKGIRRVGDIQHAYSNFIDADWDGTVRTFEHPMFAFIPVVEIKESRFREILAEAERGPEIQRRAASNLETETRHDAKKSDQTPISIHSIGTPAADSVHQGSKPTPTVKIDTFDFSGEAIEYISLEQARLAAMRTARDEPGNYGESYAGIRMVFQAVEQTEGEDYYEVTLSFRPEGDFEGEVGKEQFFIDKVSTIAHRQILGLPRPLTSTSADRRWQRVAIALAVVLLTAVIIVLALSNLGP